MIFDINIQLVKYTFKYIGRYRYKNVFIVIVMSLLVSLLSTTLFIADAMKNEYKAMIQQKADILLVSQKLSHDTTMKESIIDDLLEIKGVSSAIGMVEGKYFFSKADEQLYIIGVDSYETYPSLYVNKFVTQLNDRENAMLLSKRLKRVLKKYYYNDYFNFIKPDGSLKKISIVGLIDEGSYIERNSFIVMLKDQAREIFGINYDEITAVSVTVNNKAEIAFIAKKISVDYSNMKVIVRDDLIRKYEDIYNYRSGFFLTIFCITFFTFFIIIYDKVSGLNSDQKREVGILKAIGWRIEDILKTKLYEGVIIALFSYSMGVTIAIIYTFVFDAPLLKDIFLNNYDILNGFKLHLFIDYATLVLLFMLSVPVYIAATIIPSWIVATADADEILR